MISKIKLKISNFIKRHKNKIYSLGRKIGVVAMIIFIATIILVLLSDDESTINEQEDKKNLYKPTQTVVKGENISKEEYESDSMLINTFLEFCNASKIEEAYSLISDECKEEKYPTIEDFKKYYHEYIFDKKRNCSLQAWITEGDYVVYRVRYTNDMLATGTYDEKDVYQDYLTLNRKNDVQRISISDFIDSAECNIVTKTDEIEAKVRKKRIYLDEEVYEIQIKNNTDKTILLDNLETSTTILLMAEDREYLPYKNKLYISNLILEPGETNWITIRFMKNFSSNYASDEIQFLRVIKDYDAYKLYKQETDNIPEYKDYAEIIIKVED